MGFEDLDTNQQKLVTLYLQAVLEANEHLNLTRITSQESAFLLHVEDSLSAFPEFKKAPAGLYGDLGSGGGFPGVPIAIATGRETYLIDVRQKKMAAVAQILYELGLNTYIHTYTGRAELLAREMPEAFSVLSARALAKLSVLLELASPLLSQNGLLICYKSFVDSSEFNNAQRVAKLVGMKLISDRSFMLANSKNAPHNNDEGAYDRRILTFEKVSQPKVKLPRLEGVAQKNPL